MLFLMQLCFSKLFMYALLELSPSPSSTAFDATRRTSDLCRNPWVPLSFSYWILWGRLSFLWSTFCVLPVKSIADWWWSAQAIPRVPKIKEGYNPATWMLDISSQASEMHLGVDFAEIYKNSTLYQWVSNQFSHSCKPCYHFAQGMILFPAC